MGDTAGGVVGKQAAAPTYRVRVGPILMPFPKHPCSMFTPNTRSVLTGVLRWSWTDKNGNRGEMRLMAKVLIRIGCGCGFATHDLEEAGNHADSTKHQMFISGSLGPTKRKPAPKRLPLSVIIGVGLDEEGEEERFPHGN